MRLANFKRVGPPDREPALDVPPKRTRNGEKRQTDTTGDIFDSSTTYLVGLRAELTDARTVVTNAQLWTNNLKAEVSRLIKVIGAMNKEKVLVKLF